MSKLLSLLLTLFLFSSVYADERMSKDDLLKQWDGKVVTMNGQEDALVSFKVVNGEILHITNEDSHNIESKNTDVWIRDNGKLCIEYSHNDDCQRVIKTFDGVFTFKSDFALEKRILTLSDNIEEVIAARTLKNNKPHIRAVDNLEHRDSIAYAAGESEGFSGKLVATYSNGKKETEINYQDGRLFGLTTKYFKNGNKDIEIYYKNGDKTSEVIYYNNFLNFKNYKTTFHTGRYQGYYRPFSVVYYSRYYKLIPFIILIAYGGMLCIRRRNTDYFIKWLVSLSVIIISQSIIPLNIFNDISNTIFFIALYILIFLNYFYAISISNAKSLTRYLISIPLLITLMSWIGVMWMYLSAFG